MPSGPKPQVHHATSPISSPPSDTNVSSGDSGDSFAALNQVSLSNEDDSIYDVLLNTARTSDAVSVNPEALIFVPAKLEGR
jgi:hypothetical protein